MQLDDLAQVARAAKKRPIARAPEMLAVDLGRDAIERLLPHRDPFLFVDRITALDLERRTCVGERTITLDDPVFRGHFPGDPIYPGVLLLETMGQLGCCLASLIRLGCVTVGDDVRPAAVRALKIHTATFQAEVRPGAALTVLARASEVDDWGAVCVGQILAGDVVVTSSISEVHFVEA